MATKIDNLIQEIQDIFNQIKSNIILDFKAQILTINQEANDLKDRLKNKIDELTTSPRSPEIEELKQDIDGSRFPGPIILCNC